MVGSRAENDKLNVEGNRRQPNQAPPGRARPLPNHAYTEMLEMLDLVSVKKIDSANGTFNYISTVILHMLYSLTTTLGLYWEIRAAQR